jgi:hypothetical protein
VKDANPEVVGRLGRSPAGSGRIWDDSATKETGSGVREPGRIKD